MTDSELVACPIEGCRYSFDPVAAAHDPHFQCPGCGQGWSDFHDAVECVEPADHEQDDVAVVEEPHELEEDEEEDVKIEYPFDGPGGIVR